MGRYDKIKVYDGTDFVQPSRIRYYQNNSWQDLGLNDSDNQKSMYLYTGEFTKERITLNKHVETIVTENYVENANGFNLLPATGYCFCPKESTSGGNYTFIFEATIRKTQAGDKIVFWTGTGTHSWLEINWLNDGRIRVTNKTNFGSGNIEYLYTSNSVGLNQWVHLKVYQAINTTTMTVTFNGIASSARKIQTWVVSDATNRVGSAGIQFKDTLIVQGSQYPSYSNNATLDMNTISGNGGQYQNVTRVTESTQVVTWI